MYGLINNSSITTSPIEILMHFWVSQTICFRILHYFSKKCWLFWDIAQDMFNFGFGAVPLKPPPIDLYTIGIGLSSQWYFLVCHEGSKENSKTDWQKQKTKQNKTKQRKKKTIFLLFYMDFGPNTKRLGLDLTCRLLFENLWNRQVLVFSSTPSSCFEYTWRFLLHV